MAKRAQPKPAKKPTGRPPMELTDELAAEICDLLGAGLSLRKICKRPDMPAMTTVLKWLATIPPFAAQYAHAREVQADTMVDEMLEISDDKSLDPNDRRIRIDTRKWIAAKMRPKKYGDRTDVAVSGTLTLEALVAESMAPSEDAAPE